MAGGATQQSLRRALGALKDTTTVSLAKVNSEFKDLDIAVVKATNHVECPPKDKHVRVIFLATSASRPRSDVTYCLLALAKRLSKTHNWTVALKALIVIHRLLREGDPTLKEEIVAYANSSSSRGQLLNLSNFKDDSSPNAWDYSAWVRTYALYLAERVECLRILRYDIESERVQAHSRTRTLQTDDLLEQLPALQQLLHRLVGCQPEGAALSNYIIQYALALVLKESFKLYCAINDGIINLLDKFFEMQRHDAMKALDIYKRAAQQTDKLSQFYDVCKNLDTARNFQFPSLAQPPQTFLATMEDYVKEAPRLMMVPREIGDYNDEIPMSRLRITYHEKGEESEPEAPPTEGSVVSVEAFPSEPPPMKENGVVSHNTDLLGLHEFHPDALALEESNALALAIVPAGTSNGNSGSTQNISDFTGWELAVVPSSNDSALRNSKLAGGFDQLTLDSLYEDALMRRAPYSTSANDFGGMTNPFGSNLNAYSGVQDPFIASSSVAPPPNVQMAAMAQQQQAMLLNQSFLHQQQMMGTPAVSNPFGNPYAFSNPYPYGQQQQYQHNPFGNPGLL